MNVKRLIFLGFLALSLNLSYAEEKNQLKPSTENKKKNDLPVITFRGTPFNIVGSLPKVGSPMIDATLCAERMKDVKISDYKGKWIILNVFPSLDTNVCATSVRKFNEEASRLHNTSILCISMDLPFAQARFCSTEGIKNVVPLSAFRSDFGKKYGIKIKNGPMRHILARSVFVINPEGKIIYAELVKEQSEEPNYQAAIEKIKM